MQNDLKARAYIYMNIQKMSVKFWYKSREREWKEGREMVCKQNGIEKREEKARYIKESEH